MKKTEIYYSLPKNDLKSRKMTLNTLTIKIVSVIMYNTENDFLCKLYFSVILKVAAEYNFERQSFGADF